MALVKASGTVANFRQSTEIKSATHTTGAFGMGRTTMKTEKVFNFRVGNRPVSMKFPKGDIDLTDGDEATVVGTESGGGLKGIAVRNDVTGVTYGITMGYWIGWGVAMTVLGFLLMPVMIGAVILPVGLYMLYKGYQLKNALAILAA